MNMFNAGVRISPYTQKYDGYRDAPSVKPKNNPDFDRQYKRITRKQDQFSQLGKALISKNKRKHNPCGFVGDYSDS